MVIKQKKALIALEDGTVFEGRAFAGQGEITGELVFNTAMTGYQEILTDPSYHGQIVTLTYPLIGNYGTNPQDAESWKPHVEGLVIGECSRIASNWRSTQSLPEYLEKHGILGVHFVDTRAVTLHIRSKGAMKCVVSTEDLDKNSLVKKARESAGLVGRNLSSEVSTPERFNWREKEAELTGTEPEQVEREERKNGPLKVAVVDCGVKYNQLRLMHRMGCDLEVFPNRAAAAEILGTNPDGIFISNGPGDPAGAPEVSDMVRTLAESGTPTFGICFGHQMLGLAMGGKTFKLKFGHRGANQPVMDLSTGKVEITSQNHGFCVDIDSLPDTITTSHVNLNDKTSEGLQHKDLPLFSVQYHPEAAPGPHDAEYLFRRFIDNIEKHQG